MPTLSFDEAIQIIATKTLAGEIKWTYSTCTKSYSGAYSHWWLRLEDGLLTASPKHNPLLILPFPKRARTAAIEEAIITAAGFRALFRSLQGEGRTDDSDRQTASESHLARVE